MSTPHVFTPHVHKPGFLYAGKIPDDQGFCCFLAIPDFANLYDPVGGDESGKITSISFCRCMPDFRDGPQSFLAYDNINFGCLQC